MSGTESSRPLLFQPLTLRSVTAKNRIMVSPMCQYQSVDGGPTDWHMVYWGKFAQGGAGIVFVEETAVEDRGRKSHSCAGIYADEHIPAYRRITDFIKAMDAVPAIQLGHSGRRASSHDAAQNWRPLVPSDAADGHPPWQGISASAIPHGPGWHTPKAMDVDDIRQVVRAFVECTRRSLDAGFEVLEIHGAHGYLLHQFMSPLSNRRNDAYGGDLEGRMRFPLEVAEAVRAAWPEELPLFYRISCVDGQGGAWTLDDSVTFARALAERGVDYVDCSSGGITGDSSMPIVPRTLGYQSDFARYIREHAEVKTIAVGHIETPEQAERYLREGRGDIIAIARELMWHCDWPVYAAKTLGVPDAYDLVPPSVAHRLKLRDQTRARYSDGEGVDVAPYLRANLRPADAAG
ncbi:MAG: NADH:flavin oxidoreductase/NADH oxidase [Gammaproteobacteria bacterium]|nr:NADH:flavin oxidoreductase/NADH oxidase [Gammaproteobacteria bacterium]